MSTRSAARQKPDPIPEEPSLYLGDLLRAELARADGLPRSEVTRRRLLIAATDIIQEGGFGQLAVTAICRAAGFAHGTFYLHWEDRRGVAAAVISDLMEAIRRHRPRPPQGASFHERLVVGHRYYIAMYRQNAGLMRCQGQLADELPGFAAIGRTANRALAERVLRAVAREGLQAEGTEAERLATVLSCIAMVDKLLHDVFNRNLDLGLDDEALARSVSRTWFRALFGRDPDPASPPPGH